MASILNVMSPSPEKLSPYALSWFASSFRLITYPDVLRKASLRTVLYLYMPNGRRIRYHMTTDDLRRLATDARTQLKQRMRKQARKVPYDPRRAK